MRIRVQGYLNSDSIAVLRKRCMVRCSHNMDHVELFDVFT